MQTKKGRKKEKVRKNQSIKKIYKYVSSANDWQIQCGNKEKGKINSAWSEGLGGGGRKSVVEESVICRCWEGRFLRPPPPAFFPFFFFDADLINNLNREI